MRRLAVCVALSAVSACGDSEESSVLPITGSEGPSAIAASAAFELTARVLGPASSDDDADLRITLTETNGVASRLNFLRLTCSNGAERQWGAGNIVAERGSNRVPGGAELILIRHYVCPSSSRPRELLADLLDESGFTHRVTAAPFHPDWPGS